MMFLISKDTWKSRSMPRKRVLRQLHRRMVRLLTAFLDLNGSSRVGVVSCKAPYAVAPDVRRQIGDVFKQDGRRRSMPPLQTNVAV